MGGDVSIGARAMKATIRGAGAAGRNAGIARMLDAGELLVVNFAEGES